MKNIPPFIRSSLNQSKPAELRDRMTEQGYLFLPGLLTPSAVAEVRQDILNICEAQGWVDSEGTPRGNKVVEGEEAFWDVYDPLQRLESFHTLAHHTELLNVVEMLVQERPLVHPRNIARIVYPRTDHFTTPAHQDFIHIQGTTETYTAWFPLHDCPMNRGTLVVLAGSHKQNLLPVHEAAGAGGLRVDTENMGLDWHGSDFAAGDVLLFHSYTVHKALANSTNSLRISVDYRYQGVSQPIVPDGLLPHYNRQSWDEIYTSWKHSDLQYYWQALDIKLAQRDSSIRKPANTGT
jgi:ectoine hydroxylase-related dioxygenase (phytanoyl-CoA dioxygenase family)